MGRGRTRRTRRRTTRRDEDTTVKGKEVKRKYFLKSKVLRGAEKNALPGRWCGRVLLLAHLLLRVRACASQARARARAQAQAQAL